MPSIHVGWAAVVSMGIVSASTSRWKWIFLGHLMLTMIAVSATGNHWWLDGIVAIVLLVMALFVEPRIRDKIREPLAQRRTLDRIPSGDPQLESPSAFH